MRLHCMIEETGNIVKNVPKKILPNTIFWQTIMNFQIYIRHSSFSTPKGAQPCFKSTHWKEQRQEKVHPA